MTHSAFCRRGRRRNRYQAAARSGLATCGFKAVSRVEGDMSGDLFIRSSAPEVKPAALVGVYNRSAHLEQVLIKMERQWLASWATRSR